MRRTLLSLVMLFFITCTWAQEEDSGPVGRPDFNISMIIGGDASIIGLGLEKMFFIKPKVALAAKLGFGTNQDFHIFSSDPPVNYFILSQNFTANFGRGRSYLECGLGGALITWAAESHYVVYPLVGYRFHPLKKARVSFKAWVYYPYDKTFTFNSNDIFLLPSGISMGIAL